VKDLSRSSISCLVELTGKSTSSQTTSAAGSSTPPFDWKELSNAILDLCTPSSSVGLYVSVLQTFLQS